MRIVFVLLAFGVIAGCNNPTGTDTDTGPTGGCGPMPMNGFPLCSACVLCGPPMDSMGRRGCTDGVSRGCLECVTDTWRMQTITGCFDDSGVHSDASHVDAFVAGDTGPIDAASDVGASDASASDVGVSDASSSDVGVSDASMTDAAATDAAVTDAGTADVGADAP